MGSGRFDEVIARSYGDLIGLCEIYEVIAWVLVDLFGLCGFTLGTGECSALLGLQQSLILCLVLGFGGFDLGTGGETWKFADGVSEIRSGLICG